MRVGVAGGAGYTGGELIRLLLGHPRFQLTTVASASHAGRPVADAHPNLRGICDLVFSPDLDPGGLDAVFLAEGHGKSMGRMGRLAARPGIKIVDLSGDFRLADAAAYERFYAEPHAAPALLDSFVYGLAELERDRIVGAERVANPGCFATAVLLALGPLARAGLSGVARVCATTGSSGSGAAPGEATHHPTRAASMRAYKPLAHQHAPEIDALLGGLSAALVPVSGPFVRGIYAVCQFKAPDGWNDATLRGIYGEAYAGRPFVRPVDEPPRLSAVVGGNYCDLYARIEGGEGVAIAAIDNLIKGAAGQAVQNLNLMAGLDEAAGLALAGVYP